ncbi:MAG: response regulator [Halobacteriales archaeon]|nr:response regulator [Halobacteriales archaeon]
MTEITLPSVQNEISVLVVDDDQMLADLFREWVLEKWPCKSVNRGKEALENLNGDPSIILLDREMPDLHGDEVARRLRELNSTTQIMMVSGLEPDFDISDLSIENYLNKPVDRPTLTGKNRGVDHSTFIRSRDPEILCGYVET